MNLAIPPALNRFKNDIAKTITPYIHIEPVPLLFNERLGIRDSKFGGIPYLKKLEDYPFSRTGHPMKLLAQINLDDLTEHHMHLPGFPQQGLLQFFLPFDLDKEDEMQRFLSHKAEDMRKSQEFIAGTDNRTKMHSVDFNKKDNDFTHYSCPYYHSDAVQEHPLSHTYHPYGGIDFDDFRIIYHDDFSQPALINSQVEELSACYDNFPIFTEMRLNLDWKKEYCGLEDNRNEHFYGRKVWARLNQEESASFYDDIKNTGCKMGGYASFLQLDPRRHQQHPELLLQIDSCNCYGDNDKQTKDTRQSQLKNKKHFNDYDYENWGDCSMIHFFISQEDLVQCRFDNVRYHRDHY